MSGGTVRRGGRGRRQWLPAQAVGLGHVPVYDTPDDAVAARFTLVLNGLGSVRTKTMKAFPEAAYRGIVASLG